MRTSGNQVNHKKPLRFRYSVSTLITQEPSFSAVKGFLLISIGSVKARIGFVHAPYFWTISVQPSNKWGNCQARANTEEFRMLVGSHYSHSPNDKYHPPTSSLAIPISRNAAMLKLVRLSRAHCITPVALRQPKPRASFFDTLARDSHTAHIWRKLTPDVYAPKAVLLHIAPAPECGRSVDQGGESDEGSDPEGLHAVQLD